MIRTLYARITSLDINERPVETIEGLVIQSGSINLDGDSAVRRSCSLQLVTQPKDYLWALKTKFRLYIGVSEDDGPIEWYKQGTFVITSFSSNVSTNNCTVSIGGQDKMCLLNGEVGGVLNAEHDFGSYEQVEKDGTISIIKYPIKDIIRKAVHKYGGEPLHNIIINDLDNRGMKLLEYRYDTPLFLVRPVNGVGEYINGYLDGTIKIIKSDGSTDTLGGMAEEEYEYLVKGLLSNSNPTIFHFEGDETEYIAAKIDYGETVGYEATDLIYSNDLILAAGSTITTLLDNIKKFLGNFEYFYDVDGRFIFREKPNYVNTHWSPLSTSEDGKQFINPNVLEPIQYNFSGSKLITTLSLQPSLKDVKNDFTVWGNRKNAAGDQIPIHMRLALDVKPYGYKTIEVKADDPALIRYNAAFGAALKAQKSKIYKADTTTRRYVEEPLAEVIGFRSDEEIFGIPGYVVDQGAYDKLVLTTGSTVSDSIVDWREVIYQMALDYLKYGQLDDFELRVAAANPILYPTGKTGYEQYYADLEGFWRQLYNPKGDEIVNENFTSDGKYEYYDIDGPYPCWNKDVFLRPTLLNFWFDFIDASGDMEQFSVRAIGSRLKVENNSAVTAIAYFETPNIVFVGEGQNNTISAATGYQSFQLPKEFQGMFSMSTQGKSAYEHLQETIYKHAYCAENVTVNCVPVYSLEPNRRIYINDAISGINGEFIPTKITIPLAYNGTMSLTTSRVIERIL